MTDMRDYKTLLASLKCTESGKQALKQVPSELKGRDRQFILLLSLSDHLSHQACEHIVDKVDVQRLVDLRYITYQQDSDGNEYTAEMTDEDWQTDANGIESNEVYDLSDGNNVRNLGNENAVVVTEPVKQSDGSNKEADERLEAMAPDPILQVISGSYIDA